MITIHFPHVSLSEDTMPVVIPSGVTVMTTYRSERGAADKLIERLTPIYVELAEEFPEISLEVHYGGLVR